MPEVLTIHYIYYNFTKKVTVKVTYFRRILRTNLIIAFTLFRLPCVSKEARLVTRPKIAIRDKASYLYVICHSITYKKRILTKHA